MNQINPLAMSILGSVHQQKVLGIEKNRQLRRAKVLEKDVATEDEQLESEVETADAIVPAVHDQSQQQQEAPKRQPSPQSAEEEKPHIDIRG